MLGSFVLSCFQDDIINRELSYPGLCRRRGWSEPKYACSRDAEGYTCLVLVNDREYQTDLTYESDVLAQENAAMRAFMVCRNFSVNGGMLARNGIVQGLPVNDTNFRNPTSGFQTLQSSQSSHQFQSTSHAHASPYHQQNKHRHPHSGYGFSHEHSVNPVDADWDSYSHRSRQHSSSSSNMSIEDPETSRYWWLLSTKLFQHDTENTRGKYAQCAMCPELCGFILLIKHYISFFISDLLNETGQSIYWL